jgi:bacteriocin biosynthesis cyclodehydratase domain-containing protein
MILRLDPRLPLVWRDPSSVQVGIDPPRVVLRELSTQDERMLAALVVGVTEPGLTMIANGDPVARDAMLAAVASALEVPEERREAPGVAVSGSSPLADELTRLLAMSGVRVSTSRDPVDLADSQPDLAVLTGEHVLRPESHALWLRRDVPHLPVVLGDSGVTIGPLVEPGTGPCLLCLELHRRDADGAWPAVATQLLGRRSRVGTPALVSEAAGFAARVVLERLTHARPWRAARSTRLDARTGERSEQVWEAHPECGCRGIARLVTMRGRRESGSVPVARHARGPERRPS